MSKMPSETEVAIVAIVALGVFVLFAVLATLLMMPQMLLRSSTSKMPSETAVAIVALGVFVLFAVLATLLMEPREPDQQKQFLEIVEKYRDSDNAANDLANPAYQSQRARAICEFFNGNLSVTDWFGSVKDFWRMSDGRVGLAILFYKYKAEDKYIVLSGEQTLIPPSDPLNKKILSLHRWKDLHFSGTFMHSTKDCVHEVSMTTNGMREMQWLFKFESVRPKIESSAGNAR